MYHNVISQLVEEDRLCRNKSVIQVSILMQTQNYTSWAEMFISWKHLPSEVILLEKRKRTVVSPVSYCSNPRQTVTSEQTQTVLNPLHKSVLTLGSIDARVLKETLFLAHTAQFVLPSASDPPQLPFFSSMGHSPQWRWVHFPLKVFCWPTLASLYLYLPKPRSDIGCVHGAGFITSPCEERLSSFYTCSKLNWQAWNKQRGRWRACLQGKHLLSLFKLHSDRAAAAPSQPSAPPLYY